MISLVIPDDDRNDRLFDSRKDEISHLYCGRTDSGIAMHDCLGH